MRETELTPLREISAWDMVSLSSLIYLGLDIENIAVRL